MKKNNLFLCILCCGRVELLEKTIDSFKENCKDLSNYNLKIIVSDDSGDLFLNEKIKSVVTKFANDVGAADVKYRFGENVGQAASYWHVSKLVSNSTFNIDDLVFTLEEDWEFVNQFSIEELSKKLNSFFDFQNQNVNYCAVILKTDVDNFEKYVESGYNIFEFTDKEIVVAPHSLQFICRIKGNCVHNNIVSFHPHLMKTKDVIKYSTVYNLSNLTKIKQSAENLLGEITEGLRTFIIDKVYATHIGNYRLYSVFPGAKIRSGVSILNIDEYKKSVIV